MCTEQQGRIWPINPHQIEATVSGYLGPGRVAGNCQDSAFSRQVAMYLAKHVGRWSTTRIGKFYNGRHHTTVLYSIEKIESLREKDASLDALLELLCAELSPGVHKCRFCRLDDGTRVSTVSSISRCQ
jgi:hypothetical protein